MVSVLWTGGWDSTFRVLDLLHNTDYVVQPYYLIYLGRQSTYHELATVNRLMDDLSHFGARLRKPWIQLADRYKYAEEPYAGALKTVLKTHHLGTQYLCLAQFRDAVDCSDIELCVVADDCASECMRGYEHFDSDGVATVAIDAPAPIRILLGGFRFPLLRLKKDQLFQSAERQGFLPLLEKSWFCHQPIEGAPCGHCAPCRNVVAQGLEYRLGQRGLQRYLATVRGE